MKNKKLETALSDEIQALLADRKSLMLSTIDADGEPYASYAPFALENQNIYLLISEIALHALHLQRHPRAAVLIMEDEDNAEELFARCRLAFQVSATQIQTGSEQWLAGINVLARRHGDRINSLSQLADFKLFRLASLGGRYVKGFGKAYQIQAGSFDGQDLAHLTDGHTPRVAR